MAEQSFFGLKFDPENLTFTHKVIAGAVVGALLFGGIGYYVIYPKHEQLNKLNEEIAEQEDKIETKQAQVKNLDKLKLELASIKKRLVLLRRKIPTSPNVAALLMDLENIIENEALHGNDSVLNDFKPSGLVSATLPASMKDAANSETAKQLKQLPVSIKISNISYPDFIELLTDLESYERTLSLEAISLIPVESQDSLYTPVDVSFKVKAYLLEGGS